MVNGKPTKKSDLYVDVYEFFKNIHFGAYLPEVNLSLVEKTVKGLSDLTINLLDEPYQWDQNSNKVLFSNKLYNVNTASISIEAQYPMLYNRSLLPFNKTICVIL